MSIDLKKAGERPFRRYVEENLWEEIDPDAPLLKPMAREVRVGAFVFDLVAANALGGLTIVEFKVNAAKDTLAQLLLYPRAAEGVLASEDRAAPDIRMVLVTSYLDRGVVDVVCRISPPRPIFFRLALQGSEGQCHLIDPVKREVEGQAQYWDQAKAGMCQVAWADGGHVVVKGRRLRVVAQPKVVGE